MFFFLEMEENATYFCLLQVSIFSAVLKENVNWPANFSGLISARKVIIFGSCGRGVNGYVLGFPATVQIVGNW